MKKQIALAGAILCAATLVLAGRFILAPQVPLQAVPIAKEGDDKKSDSPGASSTSAVVKKEAKKEASSDDGFHFVDDRGGKLLSQILVPISLPGGERSERKGTSGPAAVEQPALPAPTVAVSLVRLPAGPPAQVQQPGAIAEDMPFVGIRLNPQIPQVQTLLTAERVRIPSADVNQPIGLPVLARPAFDRASLEDPSTDASFATSITAPMPSRTAQAPYLRLSIPNPYEFRDAVQSKSTLDEDPQPISSTPRLPR